VSIRLTALTQGGCSAGAAHAPVPVPAAGAAESLIGPGLSVRGARATCETPERVGASGLPRQWMLTVTRVF